MSAPSFVGSSLINKSGKRIVPKAAPKRRAAPTKFPTPDSTADTRQLPRQPSVTHDTPVECNENAPPITASEVLEAQINVQQVVETNRAASKPTHEDIATSFGEEAAKIQDELESGTLLDDIHKPAESAGTNTRAKRRRLNNPESTRARSQRVSKHSNTRYDGRNSQTLSQRQASSAVSPSRTRTVPAAEIPDIQLPTPIATQQLRPVSEDKEKARRKSVRASATASTASLVQATPPSGVESRRRAEKSPLISSRKVAEDGENEEHDVVDGIWVNATQDNMKKRGRTALTWRAPFTARAIERPVQSVEIPAMDSTAPATANSARIANRAKRLQKKKALKASLAPVEQAEGNAKDNDEYGHNGSAEVEAEADNDYSVNGRERPQKIRQPRKRVSTPEEAETVTIVPSVVTMFDLAAKDRRTGMKSDRERKMQAIDWDLVKKRRREEEVKRALDRGRRRNLTPDPEEDEEELENDDDLDAALTREAARNRQSGKLQGVRVRVINGDHVVDEQSQRVDRHAMANEDLEALEQVDHEELTQQFNSHTYIHLKRREPAERIPSKDKWDTHQTDKFYDCLSRFGTDFMIISKMFPGRTRRQIKAKFVREERADFDRVQEALRGSVNSERPSWDLEVFREGAGLDLSAFKDPRVVEAELLALRVQREALIEEQKKNTAEEKRQRRLAGEVSEEEEDEDAVGEDGQPAKKCQNEPRRTLADDELEELEEFE